MTPLEPGYHMLGQEAAENIGVGLFAGGDKDNKISFSQLSTVPITIAFESALLKGVEQILGSTSFTGGLVR